MNDIDYDALASNLPVTHMRDLADNTAVFRAALHVLIAAHRAGDTTWRLPGELAGVLHSAISYSGSQRSLCSKLGRMLKSALNGVHITGNTKWKIEQRVHHNRLYYRVTRQ